MFPFAFIYVCLQIQFTSKLTGLCEIPAKPIYSTFVQIKSKTIKYYSLNLMKFLYTENQKDGHA